MPSAEVLREIRRATAPHGVTAGDGLALTKHQWNGAVNAGVLVRPHRNVYVDPFAPLTPLKQLATAIASGGYLASAWGRSAAALWGLIDDHPSVPEIVVPVRRRARVAGANVHRSVELCPDHVMFHRRIRTTKPLVTMIDLGVVMPPMDIAEVIIRGRELKLFEVDGVRAAIARLARPGRTGIVAAREAVELVMIGEKPAESVLELRFHHGPGRLLPPYFYQHEIKIRGKWYVIDFAYPPVKVAIEVDGFDKRRTLRSLSRDARRGNQITLDGWLILHFTWDRIVNEPATVASEILAALWSRGYQFAA
jgi:hypothetical protein